MTSQHEEVPENMLISGDKLVGVFTAVGRMPTQPGLQFRTCMHDQLVEATNLQFTIERGYGMKVLTGYRQGPILNILIHCMRHGTELEWNDGVVYPVAVGYVAPANKGNPEHNIIVLVVTFEVEADDGCH